jgi:hypothetical protein
MNGDMVCAGVKKSDSTDLAVETLSRTSFTAWTGFGFEWLAGFQAAGSPVVNRSNPGTGDETARTSVSLVSDPPGWVWAPVATPVAGFTGTPLSGTPPFSVTFTDTSTEHPHQLGVGLRGRRHQHQPEPVAQLRDLRGVHGRDDRHQRQRIEHHDQDRLHHRR